MFLLRRIIFFLACILVVNFWLNNIFVKIKRKMKIVVVFLFVLAPLLGVLNAQTISDGVKENVNDTVNSVVLKRLPVEVNSNDVVNKLSLDFLPKNLKTNLVEPKIKAEGERVKLAVLKEKEVVKATEVGSELTELKEKEAAVGSELTELKGKEVVKVEDQKLELAEVKTKKEAKTKKEKKKKRKKKGKKIIDTTIPPSKSFDLSDWSLSVPVDADNNGKADQVREKELVGPYANEFFYLSEDGGMVFKCPIDGYKTSENTTYTRSELREMLRAGDYSINTQGATKNNWVFEGSPSVNEAGGYGGKLTATLAVNHVTTTGEAKHVGRVIIGQIHAHHNEPLRLYYRKLPNNKKGSIYFAHEGRVNGEEDFYELIGAKSNELNDPADGIALNEKFSYEVIVAGTALSIRIIRPNKPTIHKVISMSKSDYAVKDEYMYFKAGVYNQNKTGRPADYVQATFYELSNSHTK